MKHNYLTSGCCGSPVLKDTDEYGNEIYFCKFCGSVCEVHRSGKKERERSYGKEKFDREHEGEDW